ncbi:MAG TPA: alpha/beta hydrolase [Vicinamibacterales bacterium]|nr:alpha/beta hydrolase [Vicinamibacterales bacterium]
MWIVALVAAGVAGIVTQSVCVRRDRRRFPPPGRMIGGLHVRQVGTRGPVVVFEAGIAATCLNWSRVQAEMMGRAQTVSYDRAGLGWSPPAHGDRSLRQLTDDLHRLIHSLDPAPPVILTGHSFGTFVVRVYAHRFPDDVSALVLVDPVVPEEFTPGTLRTRLRLARAALLSYVASVLAAFGLVRLGLWGLLRRGGGNPGPLLGLHPTMRRVAVEVAKLPRDLVPALQARWSEPRFFRELAASIRSLPSCAAEAARQPVPAGMPVVVLSGSHQTREHLAAHEALATRHVVVQGSAHWIHLDQPSLVADAVLGSVQL